MTATTLPAVPETVSRALRSAELDHERLFVYHLALELARVAEAIAARIPPWRADLASRLRRSATSLPVRVAEGSTEIASEDKAISFQRARLHATRAAALLDVCRGLGLGRAADLEEGRKIVVRAVALLDRIIRNHRRAAHV